MILVLDNYDSFVFNLVHYVEMLGKQVVVSRNDQITIKEVHELKPEAVILSPGPRAPSDAGICVELIRQSAGLFPILGVCLGHQAIGEAFGAKITRSSCPQHGSASSIFHQRTSLFEGIPTPFSAGRYHSLIIDESTLPDSLEVIARTNDQLIMAVKHVNWPIIGLQFHPESILTEHGHKLLANFFHEGNVCSA